MKLAILGGGGFRTPLVYAAVLGAGTRRRFVEVALYDTDPTRLRAIGHVLAEQAENARLLAGGSRGAKPPVGRHTASGGGGAAKVSVTSSLDEALEGASFVFSAIRVGGLEGRVVDERLPLSLGLLGQETTGPGGVGYGLRTVPVALEIAERVRVVAPHAWVINFTNPAGMVTQAMQTVLGDRVVGICDSPLGLAKRAARALGLGLGDVAIDYAGLNHLGWLRGLRLAGDPSGRDVLPDLLGDRARLESFEEGHLFGADWLQSIGSIPNEYLWYYDFGRDAIAQISGAERTRGEFLVAQQASFYASVANSPQGALGAWDAVRRERNATYMAEARSGDDERAAADVEGGGYEGVAVDLMMALAMDRPSPLILNVRNALGGAAAVPGLPDDAVVEVPCRVDGQGPVPLSVSAITGRELGLVQQVKAVDELVLQACLEGSRSLAVQAIASHPLVDSVNVARDLMAGYHRALPDLYAGLH